MNQIRSSLKLNCWFYVEFCFLIWNSRSLFKNFQNHYFIELYGRKSLHIKSFSAIESENLVRISNFFV